MLKARLRLRLLQRRIKGEFDPALSLLLDAALHNLEALQEQEAGDGPGRERGGG